MTTLLLPATMSDSPTFPTGVHVVRYDVTEPLPDDALDAEALVVWGNGHQQATRNDVPMVGKIISGALLGPILTNRIGLNAQRCGRTWR